jgi:hypothetical protein
MANKGVCGAIATNPALSHGAITVDGHLVSAPVGEAPGIEVATLDTLLN